MLLIAFAVTSCQKDDDKELRKSFHFSGTVFSHRTGEPLRGIPVTAFVPLPVNEETGISITLTPMVRTDANGRFLLEFSHLGNIRDDVVRLLINNLGNEGANLRYETIEFEFNVDHSGAGMIWGNIGLRER